MSAKDDVAAQIGPLLPAAHLTSMNYQSISVDRLAGDDPGEAVIAGVEVTMNFQRPEPGTLLFKFDVASARPDVEATVSVVLAYEVPEQAGLWEDDYVVAVFGEKVAFPAAYPFARAKVFASTVDLGVRPILLDVVSMGAERVFVPDDREAAITGPLEPTAIDA